ncbi:MAG: hypothetical protein R2880_02750 [Deinococcales bacterium]
MRQEKLKSIDETAIKVFVDHFYAQIRHDEVLGPLFLAILLAIGNLTSTNSMIFGRVCF